MELLLRPVPLKVIPVGDVRLATKNRLDGRQPLEPLLLGVAGIIERLEGEKVAVIRDCKGRHSPPAGLFHKRVYLALPIQQGICCMQMKMDEIAHVTSPRS